MLMMDRITDVSEDGGAHGKGHIVAEFDITPDLCSSAATFPATRSCPAAWAGRAVAADRLQPGLARGWQGRGYALGVGEVKLTGMVRPDRKMLRYTVDFTKAVQTRRLTMGVADGGSRRTES